MIEGILLFNAGMLEPIMQRTLPHYWWRIIAVQMEYLKTVIYFRPCGRDFQRGQYLHEHDPKGKVAAAYQSLTEECVLGNE